MILALNSSGTEGPEKQRNWLIFADAIGTGNKLAQSLREQGDRCVLVSAGDRFETKDSDQYSINPTSAQDFERLFAKAAESSPNWHGIVHLWNMDADSAETMDASALNDAQLRNSGSAMYLVQAMTKLRQAEPPRLWLVTRGAVPLPESSSLSLAQTPAIGLGKVIALEHPELQCTYIDLGTANSDQVGQLYAEITAGNREDQVALHDQRYVARLARYAPEQTHQGFQNNPVHLIVTQRGTLENLLLESVPRRDPAAGEVEIRVRATGLNFRDLLNALDMYPGDPGPLGGECAGEVIAVGSGVTEFKVGDNVMGLIPDCFRTYVIAPVNMIAHKPAHLSFEEAATMLIPYMTADFTLHHLGQIRAGEKVLIHAAAGGVGLAAVKLALQAGAEIFATAGNPEKRAYLQTLGVQHLLDSRSLNFADDILQLTQGAGVDLVLNSLADEFCMKSLSVLAKNGRFLEIGKRGILSPTEVADLRPDVSYFVVDWSETFRTEPALMRHLLGELVSKLEDKTFSPLPLRRFRLENAVEAFRYMTKAKHIGKIVITQEHQSSSLTSTFQPDATFLITGGLRGLGLLVATWMVGKGARHLVLLGRSTPDAAAQRAIQEMEQAGAEIVIVQADVSLAREINEVFQKIEKELPPLRGVIHSAGVLADGMLINQDWSGFSKVFAPKVEGTWHLHKLTKNMSLDFFVMFSSVASLLGSPGQANHAAANMFMDMLAHHRQAQGLPALSINWGAWSQTGAAVEYGVADRVIQRGMSTFSPEEGLQVLEYLLGQPVPQVAVARMNWLVFMKQYHPGAELPFFADIVRGVQSRAEPAQLPENKREALWLQLQQAPLHKRQPLLSAYIQSQVCKVLGLDSGQKLNEDMPLSEVGLDSLMAVEVRNILGATLNLKRALPATLVFDYPTVSAITAYLMTEMDLAPTEEQPGQPSGKPQKDAAIDGSMLRLLDALEDLSDEEVDRMLADQLKEGKSSNE